MTLLGVEPGYPRISAVGGGVEYNYNTTSAVGTFDLSSAPVTYTPSSGPQQDIFGRSFVLKFQTDGAGHVTGGVDGDDFIIDGIIDLNQNNQLDPGEDGVLLTGEIIDMGYQNDPGPTDFFDFRLKVTGGLMAGDYAGKDIGITLIAENSTFQDFTVNFHSLVKADTGPIPTLFKNITISGDKFNDITGNGITGDDAPLSGVTIQLLKDNVVVATTVTDDHGHYAFPNLGPGTYMVQEVVPDGWLQTGGPASYTITATSGADSAGNNFANFKKVTISGTKFTDLTGNSFSGDDTPLAGVTINLYDAANLATPIASTVTLADGTYKFENLGPGTYFVQEVVPAGYNQTGGTGGYTVPATSGLVSLGNDFDNYLLKPAIDIEKYVQPEVTNVGGEGLTPGFWKQTQHFYAWTSLYVPTGPTATNYDDVFGLTAAQDDPTLTLLGALGRGGGGKNALGRHAAAALLNAANPFVAYAFTTAQIITMVKNAYLSGDYETTKNILAQENEKEADLSTPAPSTPAPTGYGYDADTPGSGPTVVAGTQLTFTFVVTNTGETPLINVVVTDDNETPSDTADDYHPTPVLEGGFNVGDDNADGILDVGEVWIYTVVKSAVAGSHTNIANVVGTPVDTKGNPFTPDVTDSDAANYNVNAQNPGIDVEKTTNGPTNSNSTAPDYDNEDVPTGAGVPVLTPGSSVTWTYKVANTGNTTFTTSQITLVDDNGTAVTSDDLSIANGKITFQSVLVGDSDNLLEPGEVWIYKATGTVLNLNASTTATTFDFSGNSALYGAAGNIRTFTSGTISVKASGFSRDDNTGAWATAYLGSYGGGLGVTDTSEGTGGNNSHTLDNNGVRDNYILLEFSENVVLDSAFLGYVVGDSDMTVWIGNFPTAYTNHLTLSDSVLASMGFTEVNLTSLTGPRTADLNAGGFVGNVVVIAAKTSDTDDYFKLETLTTRKPGSIYANKATVTVPGASDSDMSHYKNPDSPSTTSITGTKFFDVTGNGLTSDDTPLAGITIKLFKDVDGDGKLTSADGASIKSAVTNASGTYTFTGLATGNYLVQEVVTGGYVRTTPALQDYYSVNATITGKTYDGYDFANAEKCDLSDFCNIYFTINGGSTKYYDLRGVTHQGDTIKAYFTYKGTEANHPVTFVSYYAPTATFDANNAYLQQIFQSTTVLAQPGKSYSMTVVVPDCYYQVDLVCGYAIDTFGPAGSNIFYSAQSRLMSADNGGTSACFCGTSTISGTVFKDLDNDGDIDANEAGIKNVKVVLTGYNDIGQYVTATDYTDSDGFYQFTGLRDGKYTVTETQPADYLDGKDDLGSLGGTLGNDVFSNINITGGNQAGINYNFGEVCKTNTAAPTLACDMTATIGFWQNKNGQALIKAMNGSCNSTKLGCWLANNFPNLFGNTTGTACNLYGKTNTQVAAAFVALFNVRGAKVEAQVMATALSVYVTDSDLAGGNYGRNYGFIVNSNGTGAATFNVGANGSAIGLTNYKSYTIAQILAAANTADAFDTSSSSQAKINDLFAKINEAGDIA